MYRASSFKRTRVVLVPRNNRDRRQGKREENPELRLELLRGLRTQTVKRGVEYTVDSEQLPSTTVVTPWRTDSGSPGLTKASAS